MRLPGCTRGLDADCLFEWRVASHSKVCERLNHAANRAARKRKEQRETKAHEAHKAHRRARYKARKEAGLLPAKKKKATTKK